VIFELSWGSVPSRLRERGKVRMAVDIIICDDDSVMDCLNIVYREADFVSERPKRIRLGRNIPIPIACGLLCVSAVAGLLFLTACTLFVWLFGKMKYALACVSSCFFDRRVCACNLRPD
jgi:hypothetical protein